MKTKICLAIIGTFIFLSACTKKIVEPVTETPTVEIPKPKTTEPKSNCISFDDLEPAILEEVKTAFVLYKDAYDMKEYSRAMPLWKKAYHSAPASNKKVKYHYDHGVVMYTDLYRKATNAELKKNYVDTIMSIYDKRIECFGDKPYVDGRKAFDLYYNFPEYGSEMETYALFKNTLDAKGDKADYFIVNPMAKLLYDNFQNGNIPKAEASSYAAKLFSAINYGTANCKKDCEAWAIVNGYAPARLEALEGVDGFYTCEYYTDKYYSSFEAAPTDCETILFVSRRMLRGECAKDNPKLVTLKNAYNTNCYTPPPPPGPLTQAFKLYNDGKYRDAVTKFDSYISTSTDPSKQAKYALLVAKIYYRDIKNFSQSRKYALQAASYRANWGEPYVLIGKLYASSGPICGPGTGWDSQIVSWPAIDKWEYAKKIDPAVSSEATKLINQYKQYMPNKEDVFIRGLKTGQSFKVTCWIKENTKIRTSN